MHVKERRRLVEKQLIVCPCLNKKTNSGTSPGFVQKNRTIQPRQRCMPSVNLVCVNAEAGGNCGQTSQILV